MLKKFLISVLVFFSAISVFAGECTGVDDYVIIQMIHGHPSFCNYSEEEYEGSFEYYRTELLDYAVNNDDALVFLYLQDHGVDLSEEAPQAYEIITRYAVENNDISMLEKVRKSGENIYYDKTLEKSYVLYALEKGSNEILKYYLDKDRKLFDTYTFNGEKNTIYNHIIRNCNEEIVFYIISEKSDLLSNENRLSFFTLFLEDSEENYNNLIKNHKNYKYLKPFWNIKAQTFEILMNQYNNGKGHILDINSINNLIITASKNSKTSETKILLSKDAYNYKFKNTEGITALDAASDPEIIKLLKEEKKKIVKLRRNEIFTKIKSNYAIIISIAVAVFIVIPAMFLILFRMKNFHIFKKSQKK